MVTELDIFSILPFVVAIVPVILTFYYFKVTTKQKRKSDYRTDILTTEEIARQKQKDEEATARIKQKDEEEKAREVKETARQIALGVKQETLEDINKTMNNMKHVIEMTKQYIESELKLMRQVSGQLRKDLEDHISEQEKTIEKMEKNLSLLSQFVWGQSSKSIPPFILGNDETQKHKDIPLEGIYSTPDSSETQQDKDNKSLEDLAGGQRKKKD